MNQRIQSTGVGARANTTLPSSTKGADVALRSVKGLTENADGKGLSDSLRRGLAAALIGVTLLGGVQTARADTVSVAAPQTAGQVYANPATGPPGLVVNGQTTGTATDSLSARLQFNRFVDGAAVSARPATVDARTSAAFDQFHTRLTQILHRDSASLASGQTPIHAGDPLSSAQQREVESALGNLVSELPVGAFGPGIRGAIESTFSAIGHDVDLSTTRLKDLGSEGGKAASDIVKQLRAQHPTTFWSVASVAAAGAVAVGYTQGTDALAKLGIKPEFSAKIFKDTKLSVGVSAGAHFSDPNATLGLNSSHTFNNGVVVRGGVEAKLRGSELTAGSLSAGVSTTGGFNANANVNVDGHFKPIDARLSVTQQFDRWHVGGDAAYNFTNDRFTSSVSAGRTFDINTKNDLDLQIRGSVDTHGSSKIGVGVTFRW